MVDGFLKFYPHLKENIAHVNVITPYSSVENVRVKKQHFIRIHELDNL